MKKHLSILLLLIAACVQNVAIARDVVIPQETVVCNTGYMGNPEFIVCTKNGLRTRPPEHLHFAMDGEKCKTVHSINKKYDAEKHLSTTGAVCRDSVIKNAVFKR